MSGPGQLAHPEQVEVQRQVKVRPGFFAAGLCVILGGVILLFVYYMALGLPSSTQATTADSNTGTAPTLRSTVNGASPTPVTPKATPTSASFPGQRYINTAQIASSVYPLGARPLQETTIFRVNQKVYVTFQLHTGEQAGAVCFIWYLNGRSLFNYSLPVRPFQNTSYSFAIYGNAGAGSVELYWASSIRCTDEILAQRVSFTVTS
jgi:hypothetical protein